MPLDSVQTAQTGSFIQKYSAAQAIPTKEGAWEIIHRAMSVPQFRPYLPEGFVPESLDNDTPTAEQAQADTDTTSQTRSDMFVYLETAYRNGDNDVRDFINRLAPMTQTLQAVVNQTPRNSIPRQPRAAQAVPDSASTDSVSASTERAPMAPRPASYVLSVDAENPVAVKSWRIIVADMLGRILAAQGNLNGVPKSWLKAENNSYMTEIPGGSGDYAYTFTCLKVDELERRTTILLGVLGTGMTVTLKDGSTVRLGQ